jgi:hypothetical protein
MDHEWEWLKRLWRSNVAASQDWQMPTIESGR